MPALLYLLWHCLHLLYFYLKSEVTANFMIRLKKKGITTLFLAFSFSFFLQTCVFTGYIEPFIFLFYIRLCIKTIIIGWYQLRLQAMRSIHLMAFFKAVPITYLYSFFHCINTFTWDYFFLLTSGQLQFTILTTRFHQYSNP